MGHSFNLIDRPFIPCCMLDARACELGLKDTLTRAREIREIRDDSPLVTVALHRLLLAIVHRNFGPRDLSDWKRVWDAGRFDAAMLASYFDRWHDRFDLYDPRHPFYQTADLMEKEAKTSPVSRLLPEASSGNNATLFDHTTDAGEVSLSPPQAARAVIAAQAFGFSGTAGKGRVQFEDTPIVRDALLLVRGKNLFQTLMLDCVPPSVAPDSADAPAWEREEWPDRTSKDAIPLGILDYLTWQSRHILLLPDPTDQEPRVRRCRIAQRLKLTDERKWAWEPMAASTRDKKAGMRSLRFDRNRSVWRDYHSLLQMGPDDLHHVVLERVHLLVARGFLARDCVYTLDALGLCTEPGRATIELWRHESLPLPLAYLSDPDLLAALRSAIDAAEEGARVLAGAVRRLAELTLKHGPTQKPDKDSINQLAATFGHEPRYWSRLEQPFRNMLLHLPGDPEHVLACRASWAGTVCQAARDVFNQIVQGQDLSARMLRAVYRQADKPAEWGALQQLHIGLSQITKPYKETSHELTPAANA